MDALDLAGKNDSVITVVTGRWICFCFESLYLFFSFLKCVSSRQAVVISTAVATTWTTSLKSQRVALRRWLRMQESSWGKHSDFLLIYPNSKVRRLIQTCCYSSQAVCKSLYWLPEASDCRRKWTSCGSFCHCTRTLRRRLRHRKCEQECQILVFFATSMKKKSWQWANANHIIYGGIIPWFEYFPFCLTQATFHTPFSNLGQSPEGCSSYTFPKIMGFAKVYRVSDEFSVWVLRVSSCLVKTYRWVGWKCCVICVQASEMLLFNKKLTATQACELGLVTEVFPDSTFQSEVWTRLKAYSKLPPNVRNSI